MAQQSFPFENIDTTESQFSKWARNFQDTGVQGSPTGTELKVTAGGSTLNIDVAAGQAFVRGHYYINTSTLILPVTSAGTNTRIDIVVVELDPTANTIVTKIVEGTAVSSSPVAPTLTQTDDGVYQLPIARITIPNSSLVIDNSMITDLRTFMSNRIGIWTTSTRPANPIENQTIGFNTTTGQHEYWNGTAWVLFTPADAVRVSDYEATGDILIATAADTPERLPIGANNTVLKSDGTTASWQPVPSPIGYYSLQNVVDGNLDNVAGDYLMTRTGDNGNLYLNNVRYSVGSSLNDEIFLTLPEDVRAEYYPNYANATFYTPSANLQYASYGGSKYLVGLSNGISSSTDTITWTTHVGQSLFATTPEPIGYNGSTYVMGDGSAPAVAPASVYVSTDFTNWSTVTLPVGITRALSKGIYANNLFIYGATSNGQIATSTDGITWTDRTNTAVWSGGISALIYGSSGFVAGENANTLILSTDGITWTSKTNTFATNYNLHDGAFGQGVYAIGTTTNGIIITAATPSGTWTSRSTGAADQFVTIAAGAGLLVAAGGAGILYTSTNGTTWTARTSGVTGTIGTMTYNATAGKFVGWTTTNNTTTASTLITSTNGITWTSSTALMHGNGIRSLPYPNVGNSVWVLTSYTDVRGGSMLYNVANETYTRTPIVNATTGWEFVYADTPGYVAGAGSGYVFASTNAITWTGAIYPWIGTVYTVHDSSTVGYYIMGGSGSASQSGLAISTDLITWESRPSTLTTTGGFVAFASGPTYVIGVGSEGTTSKIINSTNGTTWGSVIVPDTGTVIYGAVYANSSYLIYSQDGNFYASTNGLVWSTHSSPALAGTMVFDGLKFIDGEYIAATSSTLYTSTDAIEWKQRGSQTGLTNIFTDTTGTIVTVLNSSSVLREDNTGQAKLILTSLNTPTVVSQ